MTFGGRQEHAKRICQQTNHIGSSRGMSRRIRLSAIQSNSNSVVDIQAAEIKFRLTCKGLFCLTYVVQNAIEWFSRTHSFLDNRQERFGVQKTSSYIVQQKIQIGRQRKVDFRDR